MARTRTRACTHWNTVGKDVGELVRLCMCAFPASLELIATRVDGTVFCGYCYSLIASPLYISRVVDPSPARSLEDVREHVALHVLVLLSRIALGLTFAYTGRGIVGGRVKKKERNALKRKAIYFL